MSSLVDAADVGVAIHARKTQAIKMVESLKEDILKVAWRCGEMVAWQNKILRERRQFRSSCGIQYSTVCIYLPQCFNQGIRLVSGGACVVKMKCLKSTNQLQNAEVALLRFRHMILHMYES